MTTKYFVSRDHPGNPSLFAIFPQSVDHDKVYRLLEEAGIYESVVMRDPSGGVIIWNERDAYKTRGFSMTLRAEANPDDGPYITDFIRSYGNLQFLVMCDHIILLKEWLIPDQVISDGFLKGHELTKGKVLFGLGEDGLFHVTSIEHPKSNRYMKNEIENLLNTVMLCC